MSKVAALIGLSVGLMLLDGWLIGLLFFAITIIFFFIIPALLVKILLKKDEREECDGELYLWDQEGKIDYRLTINSVKEIPFKEYLKIRVNETARDDSIK